MLNRDLLYFWLFDRFLRTFRKCCHCVIHVFFWKGRRERGRDWCRDTGWKRCFLRALLGFLWIFLLWVLRWRNLLLLFFFKLRISLCELCVGIRNFFFCFNLWLGIQLWRSFVYLGLRNCLCRTRDCLGWTRDRFSWRCFIIIQWNCFRCLLLFYLNFRLATGCWRFNNWRLFLLYRDFRGT